MCVTHIYTDCYPKRTVEFHQTIVCPNSKDGISCPAHITNEHPPRTLKSNDDRSSKEYIDQGLQVPSTSKPSPHKSATATTYRYSQGDKKDKPSGREPRLRLVRKKSALVSAVTPRRKHPKERIVIVDAPDSPQGSKTLQKYAPDSPATEEFQSKTLLVAEHAHRQESASPRRGPNHSLNPVRTVVIDQHRDKRERSRERERPLQDLPILLKPEPSSRSASHDRGLVDMRIRREEEERERERQRDYEREREKSFELVHEARREQERERDEMRKITEELERERIRKEKNEDEKRKEMEYKKFLAERERERERERDKEVERQRARDREEESARERERRRRDEEIRRADDHEQRRREEKHRHEREREREIEGREREDRMRKAEISERKAADDARRLAEQVKAFAREDEEIRRRPAVPSKGKERERDVEESWKKEDDDMYARLRERQARDGSKPGLGRGASFSGRADGDKEFLDRLKERQKEPEEGYAPKRRTTIGVGGGRRRGEERIVWDEGDGGRGGRW
ncbi:predicted protein [Sclerotinia sclerotiorum 1980 UF-70]|uniref:Uncharacterized protein n=2 Tax=Sclerotinia sclerotiorum (strain ATCC 18683 / 1980 / Ss-1) TaxID=665079 RepID=A7EUB5_SCLS1|nr:predicted protein [Sclerotinia sclerotiorum 1980 UF-70]APA15286.1 hypothetical protein sscle_14g100560 [Sclerotinia sclerotiorum 1980 UF-70]EDN93057.1 predicted protein [Sclerotinia sclerotiorum 1980 UF-70]